MKTNMRSLFFAAALAALRMNMSAAHTVMTTLFVDSVDQGDGVCIRMPMTPQNSTFPIFDLASSDMACGYDGTKGVARVCPVDQGSQLSFEFREYANGAQKGAIDPSHKGPCAVYMKSVPSAISSTAVGDGWFKIWDEGYDAVSKQWCTEKLIQDDGYLSVLIPQNLKGGYYLVRTELLSLHEADRRPPKPQFYMGCAQVFLNTNATGVVKSTVSIPGYVNITDPSVGYNIYSSTASYTPPGPAPISANDLTYPSASTQAWTNGQNLTQHEGLVPPNAVLTNANWWGVELDFYTDQNGCWNASKNCFQQESACYDTAPPTGSMNCAIWDKKCMQIQSNCNAGNFVGPPNKGKILTPSLPPTPLNLPAATPIASAAPAKGISFGGITLGGDIGLPGMTIGGGFTLGGVSVAVSTMSSGGDEINAVLGSKTMSIFASMSIQTATTAVLTSPAAVSVPSTTLLPPSPSTAVRPALTSPRSSPTPTATIKSSVGQSPLWPTISSVAVTSVTVSSGALGGPITSTSVVPPVVQPTMVNTLTLVVPVLSSTRGSSGILPPPTPTTSIVAPIVQSSVVSILPNTGSPSPLPVQLATAKPMSSGSASSSSLVSASPSSSTLPSASPGVGVPFSGIVSAVHPSTTTLSTKVSVVVPTTQSMTTSTSLPPSSRPVPVVSISSQVFPILLTTLGTSTVLATMTTTLPPPPSPPSTSILVPSSSMMSSALPTLTSSLTSPSPSTASLSLETSSSSSITLASSSIVPFTSTSLSSSSTSLTPSVTSSSTSISTTPPPTTLTTSPTKPTSSPPSTSLPPSPSATTILLGPNTIIHHTAATFPTPSPSPSLTSSPSPTVLSSSTPQHLPPNTDGTCGLSIHASCFNSPFGTCCSIHGICAADSQTCGNQCQSGFGNCGGEWVGVMGRRSLGGSGDMGVGKWGLGERGVGTGNGEGEVERPPPIMTTFEKRRGGKFGHGEHRLSSYGEEGLGLGRRDDVKVDEEVEVDVEKRYSHAHQHTRTPPGKAQRRKREGKWRHAP